MPPASAPPATARGGAQTSRGDKSARAPSTGAKDRPAGKAEGAEKPKGDAKSDAKGDAAPKPAAKGDATPKPKDAGGNKSARTPDGKKPQGNPLGGADATKAVPTSADPKAAKAGGAAAASAAAAETSKGKPATKGGRPAEFRAQTGGPVAILEYLDENEHHGEKDEEAERAPKKDPKKEPADSMAWTAIKWLEQVQNLESCIAQALCVDEDEQVLEGEQALEYVRSIDSQETLFERLENGGVVAKLVEAIWPALQVLKDGPATAAELAAKWKAERAGGLLFGGLPQFFQGLEPRIGSPDPKVFKEMMADHCSRPDSQTEFTTGNYSVVTTSEVEWKFVVEPGTKDDPAPIQWPIESRLSNNESMRGHMRKLMPRAMLEKRMQQQNERIRAVGGDELQDFEVIGGRLYTGPLFVKYNGVLRGLDSPVTFLKNDMVSLVTPKEMYEKYIGTAQKWEEANGALTYDKVRKELNMYTTTIHVINSCIVKMGKLTVAKPVFRGMAGRLFPDTFWYPNEQGVKGGVELAFMSTTPDVNVAYQYSQDKFGIVVEIQQGMIDRGAEISWLSQYPHEAEVLFAPLAGLEAREMRIEMHPISQAHIIVVTMRVSINLTNPTIEQVVAKRKKIIENMSSGLIMEVRSALNKKGSNETESYIRMLSGLFSERPLAHEDVWYNEDPQFQEAVNETLRLKREVINIATFETKKLEGDAVAQLLGETSATKGKVTVLPEILFKEFHQLRVLNLDGFAGITTLPKTIGVLKHLNTLHLRECAEMLQVPPQVGKLLQLQTLNMTYCKELSQLPSQIGDLAALQSLDLAFCRGLLTLPTEIGKLAQLQNLKLQQCSALTEIPSSLGQCKELRKLSLYGCSALTSLPESIGNLPELQELNLRVCSALTHLPPTLGHGLGNLQTLDLTLCKGLTQLPDSIGKMHNLQTLFLGNCIYLKELPPKIVHLKSLVTLNLYNCGSIVKLPDNFNMLESLQVLSLQGCEKLTSLPDALALCPSLTTLTLWGCTVLTKMPDLTPLPKLQIDGVPEHLAEWEESQKRKRLEDARDGKNKQQNAPAPKAGAWDSIKKDVVKGSVAGAALAALTAGAAGGGDK
jgi:Leucine-rich repeat (LRR) protein